MGLQLGYENRDVVDSRFEIVNSGKSQLTIEDAAVFLLWAVDGDKIKAMLHGEISERAIYAMLRTFGKDFPELVRGAAVRYIAECIFPSGEPTTGVVKNDASMADRFAGVPSLKGGDGE